jgi:hypothetical protein
MMLGPGGMVARLKTSKTNFGAGPVYQNLLVGGFNIAGIIMQSK